MSVTIKRGLGFLVIALMALLVVLAAMPNDNLFANSIGAAAGIAFVIYAGMGLVTLARGLLSED